MKRSYPLYLVIQYYFLIVIQGATDYDQWSPDGVKKLWCHKNSTNQDYNSFFEIEKKHYCACYAVPEWELPDAETVLSADIEIMDLRGNNKKLLSRYPIHNSSNLFQLIYKNGNLIHLPANACEFKLVTIDVTNNLFTDIGNLSCFTELDTLIMKYNRITYFSNQTFIGMSKLRIVDLSYNLIRQLDLNVFGDGSVNILYFNGAGNSLRELDVLNLFSLNKTMCYISYENNKHFMELTNKRNFFLGQDNSIACTDVNLSNTSISQNPFIVSNSTRASQVLKYAPCGMWRYEGTAYNCDCNIAELFHMNIVNFQRVVHKNTDESYCHSPESLKNINITDLYFNKTLHDHMICDVVDGCPKNGNCRCKCTSQPSRNILIVDCSNQSCTDFPEIVPETKHAILLNMSRNYIVDVHPKQSYFDKVNILDLSGNAVRSLNENINRLNNAEKIIIVDHLLQDLPRTIQMMDPNLFRFGINGIPCSCGNRWIGEWQKYKKASPQYSLLCANYKNTSFEDFLTSANCGTESSYYWTLSIVGIVAFLLKVLLLLKFFRFDLLIFKRRLLNKNKPSLTWKIDVYVSFDEDNDEVRSFVLSNLEPFFRKNKITTYVPCRDREHGEEVIKIGNINKCKYFLLIQSRGMYDSGEIFTINKQHEIARRNEYKIAWNCFMEQTLDKFFVLSFDIEKPESFQAAKTKALHRCGLGFIMVNRKMSVYDKLVDTFNEPLKVN